MNDRVLRVIVADDHPVFRQGLRGSLSAENDIEVVAECGDGPTVVANATTARPDVVLMDIRMPEMNGIEACRMIKKNEQMKNIPVLFLTADNDEYTSLSAVEAGGDHFVTKPVRPSILIGMIQELIKA